MTTATAPAPSSARRRIPPPAPRPGKGARLELVIIAGCLISMIGFGIRSSFGLFLDPMTVARGWDRETFALAMAIQNLLWGLGMPFAGAIADRFGTVRHCHGRARSGGQLATCRRRGIVQPGGAREQIREVLFDVARGPRSAGDVVTFQQRAH